jgi:hypothetical protein
MNIEMIWEYIDPQLIIVIPMLWGIGMAVKKSTIQNRFIPALLLAGSCSVAMLHLYSTNPLADKMAISAMLFAAVTQGSVIWLAAWLGYEKFLKDGGI